MADNIVPISGMALDGLAQRVGEYGWVVGDVRKAAPGLWFVASKTTAPGAFWEVVWHHDERRPVGQQSWFTCSCPAGQDRGEMRERRRFCRHVRLAWDTEVARGGSRPRPRFDPEVFVE